MLYIRHCVSETGKGTVLSGGTLIWYRHRSLSSGMGAVMFRLKLVCIVDKRQSLYDLVFGCRRYNNLLNTLAYRKDIHQPLSSAQFKYANQKWGTFWSRYLIRLISFIKSRSKIIKKWKKLQERFFLGNLLRLYFSSTIIKSVLNSSELDELLTEKLLLWWSTYAWRLMPGEGVAFHLKRFRIESYNSKSHWRPL